jgi:hypothetical protein
MWKEHTHTHTNLVDMLVIMSNLHQIELHIRRCTYENDDLLNVFRVTKVFNKVCFDCFNILRNY